MSASDNLSLFDSIVLGIVQGLTEFFPVSSDGHLAVFQHLLGYQKQNLAFDVLLHAGTLGALFLVFKKEVSELYIQTIQLFKTLHREKSLRLFLQPTEKERPALYIWWITFITGLFGIGLEKIATQSGMSIHWTGIGFLITAGFLFWGSSRANGIKTIGQQLWYFPLIIALAQSSALLSGISRSGMTIATALLLSTRRDEAGRFSFVASIPIIFMAICYEMRKLEVSDLSHFGIMTIGVAASFVTGIFALKGLLAMLTRLSLRPFAYYCLTLGLLCFIWEMVGR